MAQHDLEKPFAPENGQPLRFVIGDVVVYTNDYGREFCFRVTGYYSRPAKACGQYARGSRYVLDWECPWFPVRESAMRLANPQKEIAC